MSDDKDRLREQLNEREKAAEDRYFAELSKKQVEKLKALRDHPNAPAEPSCPRCGAHLQITHMKGVAVDACPNGHGLWLDQQELEQIAKREGDSWLAKLLANY
jgi:DNA repair exonuclease SbcCD ATPase subunit